VKPSDVGVLRNLEGKEPKVFQCKEQNTVAMLAAIKKEVIGFWQEEKHLQRIWFKESLHSR
jgi:hypothetical protein